MSYTLIVLIAVVCVVVTFCVLCLKTLFDSVEKADKLEKRIKNIERNIGNINTAVSTMPGQFESKTKSIVENITSKQQVPVFQAPPVKMEEPKPEPVKPAMTPEKPIEPAPAPKPVAQTPPQPKEQPAPQPAKETKHITVEEEYEALLAELKQLSELDGLGHPEEVPVETPKEPEPKPAPAPQPAPAPAPAAPAKAAPPAPAEIEEIDEISLDDILMEIGIAEGDFEDVTAEVKEEIKEEVKAEVESPAPAPPVMPAPAPVPAPPAPAPQPVPVPVPQPPKPVNPLETKLVIPEMDDNVPPVKYGFSLGDILPENLAQGSALDIYFSNEKATPRRSSTRQIETEAYEVGRSGKKYTVSELEKLIRD